MFVIKLENSYLWPEKTDVFKMLIDRIVFWKIMNSFINSSLEKNKAFLVVFSQVVTQFWLQVAASEP